MKYSRVAVTSIFLCLGSSLWLSGCTMAPNYVRPAAPVPEQWGSETKNKLSVDKNTEVDKSMTSNPRTAIGINKNGRWLYLVVVDGRQPFYSEGATYQELAQILLDWGANDAMALDGGGSSVMTVLGEDGKPSILNSPIDQYIPGRERAVANHLGISLK